MKEDLQCLALRIFSMCLLSCITLEVEWIPRSANDRADFSLQFIEFLRSYHMVSEYFGMHLDPCFVDHLVFFITQGPLWPLVVIFFCVFLGTTWTQPYLVSLRVVFF